MAGDGEFERVPRPDNYPHGPEFQPRTLHQRLQGKWWYRVPPNHSKPIYQFLSIGLGASMWFWVSARITEGRHHQSSFIRSEDRPRIASVQQSGAS
ncbi:hypothetical protein NEUTE1DRAFT_119646 [Neurospora tetrasperma FGSC 2508]|uniref:Uncharacterized protein n=1 Tax=Neurospora tetrasperma (strain FGSC 2508 / ATCC MYA-4615 / P0657) TaxID=510951 RepID=F8MCM7_NEUT8|nr:uncharacterized protein NEUTE1DRAFT_119646 [Neurospora tetrasperma FGSC 2508]EGO60474.1 hypothetical protein NEUTE1DRAFT_119646 [Neurospora tetrasperma FGSC 2508]EGZ75553.1 hypothetical protein NEUTE2DRAFT_155991 [Neurospora tetrasperma FGSC 2509]